MTIKILIDLSHYEQIKSFPEYIFKNSDFFFDFTKPTDDLSDYNNLNQYDLIILGNPKPQNDSELLFRQPELTRLKGYVKNGGNLLITTGARGDYNLENSLGSLRVFYKLTGIIQYHYTILFHMTKGMFFEKKVNLVIKKFPKHPIFDKFKLDDKLIFGKSTYFTLEPNTKAKALLFSHKNTDYHDYLSDEEKNLNRVPLLVINEYYKGRVATVATSQFLIKDKYNGIEAKSNKKFLKGLLSWLLQQKIA